MRNIEIKTPLHARADVERRLEALGARRSWVRRQKDTFFGVPRGWLKLREVEGAMAELIAYRRVDDPAGFKTSHYDIEAVRDAAAWKRLLGRVLALDAVVEKERTLWFYEHTRIHLDRVVGLGDYLELETVVRDIDADAARAETGQVIEALALCPGEFISVRYRDLLRDAESKSQRPNAKSQ